jgi:hypothetical protein
MVYVLAFVVLLLAAATVVLFAMLGELYARVGGAAESTRPLQEAAVGQRPATWPAELARLADAPEAVLLVLSTACVSCNQVAEQLRDQPDPLPGLLAGVALSTPDEQRAETFIDRYGLPRESVYVDGGGRWITESFGVQTSPSALVLRDGELVSAVVFSDIETLKTAISPIKQPN